MPRKLNTNFVRRRFNEYGYRVPENFNYVNNITHIRVYDEYNNCYENITDKYNTIITNPPIRAGKKIVYEILFGAKEHLELDGSLFLVIHKDQGAKSLIKDLNDTYNVQVLEKNKGFFVIKCKIR